MKSEEYWKTILWSDETKINMFGSDGVQHVLSGLGEEYREDCMVPTVKHGGRNVMVWGCMSAKGVGELPFIDGIMDAAMYVKILESKMLPSLKKLGRQGTFQHDNDPKHAAKKTEEFLRKKRVRVITWPSMSPDLNPIEHLWGILKRKVEQHNPSNKEELKEVIIREWASITPEICEKLVASMPKRIKSVKENDGGHSKY